MMKHSVYAYDFISIAVDNSPLTICCIPPLRQSIKARVRDSFVHNMEHDILVSVACQS